MSECKECLGGGRLQVGQFTSLGVVGSYCECPYCAGTGQPLGEIVRELRAKVEQLEARIKSLEESSGAALNIARGIDGNEIRIVTDE